MLAVAESIRARAPRQRAALECEETDVMPPALACRATAFRVTRFWRLLSREQEEREVCAGCDACGCDKLLASARERAAQTSLFALAATRESKRKEVCAGCDTCARVEAIPDCSEATTLSSSWLVSCCLPRATARPAWRGT